MYLTSAPQGPARGSPGTQRAPSEVSRLNDVRVGYGDSWLGLCGAPLGELGRAEMTEGHPDWQRGRKLILQTRC